MINFKQLLYLLLLIPMVAISHESYGLRIKKDMLLNKDNLNQLCVKLNNLSKEEASLEMLNAYDRAVEKKKLNARRTSLMNTPYILKIDSSHYSLSDYRFSTSDFEVKKAKLSNKLTLSMNKKILLDVEKEDAKIVAAKKRLELLDLYIKVKIKNFNTFSKQYCSENIQENMHLEAEVYEYFFMCSQSSKVIFYKHPIDEEPFIKKPHITIPTNKKIKKIFNALENDIYVCKSKFKGHGSKIYQVDVSQQKGKQTIHLKNDSSFSNSELEDCIDSKINTQKFPSNGKAYSIYFSVVISNIDATIEKKTEF